ncbi:MAG: YdcH family protein [Proteobacteria bacterium]|nr:YdcH family protein [Pseudomonadota bacterium]
MQVASFDRPKQEEITRLTDEHRALKARLRELDKHISLTSAEQVERAQLKKMKLRTKEKLLRLQQN